MDGQKYQSGNGKATPFDVAGAFFSSRLLIAVTLWNFLLFINYWPILKISVSTNSDVKPCRWKRSLSNVLVAISNMTSRCLGEWQNYGQRILKLCGGLFILDSNGDGVTCRKCNKKCNVIEFHCSFCDKITNIGVEYRVKGHTGRAVSMQMSVHKTVVFFN